MRRGPRKWKTAAILVGTAAFFIVPAMIADRGGETTNASSTIPPSMFSVVWSTMDPSSNPGGRYLAEMVYDSDADRTLLYGGVGMTLDPLDSTWAYDASSDEWADLSPGTHPVGVFGSMVYDSVNQKTLLFGANQDLSPDNETWAYDYDANEWTDLSPSVAPRGRLAGVMAFDTRSGVAILYGGERDVPDLEFLNDTWAYNYTTNTWTQMHPASDPGKRAFASAVYDSQSDRMILFGGGFQDPSSYDDYIFNLTWSYDYDSDTWTNITPDANPPALLGCAAAYDPDTDLTVIYGGTLSMEEVAGTSELWAFDDETMEWALVSSGEAFATFTGRMTYDTHSDIGVLYGGLSPTLGLNQETVTWQDAATIPEFGLLAAPIGATILLIAVCTRVTRQRHN